MPCFCISSGLTFLLEGFLHVFSVSLFYKSDSRAERNVPLEDLLDDPKFPHLDKVAILSGGLSSVAKQLGDADLNVWKFDEEKCLSWLTDRVEAVAKVWLYKV